MNKKELVKELKLFPKIINIIGSEEIFISEAISTIIKVFVPPGTEDFNVFFCEDSMKDVSLILREYPFESEFKVVFLNTKKRNLVTPPPFTIVVSLDGGFEKPHLTIDCRKVYGRQLKALIRSKAKELELPFDAEDISLFVNRNGNDLSFLFNELFKLSCIDSPNQKTIKDLSEFNSNSRLDILFKHIAFKNVQKTLKAYFSLLDLGSSEQAIFGFLAFSFKNMVSYSLSDKSSDQFNKYSTYESVFDFQFLEDTLYFLSAYEHKLKIGRFPLYLILIAICKRDFSVCHAFSLSLDKYKNI